MQKKVYYAIFEKKAFSFIPARLAFGHIGIQPSRLAKSGVG
jgi:hypothetical protein